MVPDAACFSSCHAAVAALQAAFVPSGTCSFGMYTACCRVWHATGRCEGRVALSRVDVL